MNRIKARTREWETEHMGTEAASLTPFIAGKTILDVGGGSGFYSKYWKRNGFDTTVVDCCICVSEMRSMDRAGVKHVQEDFYKYSTENRFDTVVALYSVEVMGALQKELEHARMRVISYVLQPTDKTEWKRNRGKYISWINDVVGIAAANKDTIDVYFLLFDSKHRLLGRLSPEDVKKEWIGGAMSTLGDDWELMLVVDKKTPDAKVLFPQAFIRQSKGTNFGYR